MAKRPKSKPPRGAKRPHGGNSPTRRKPGPKEEILIIPDVQEALDNLLKKRMR